MSRGYKNRRKGGTHPAREQLGGPRSKRAKDIERARRERAATGQDDERTHSEGEGSGYECATRKAVE